MEMGIGCRNRPVSAAEGAIEAVSDVGADEFGEEEEAAIDTVGLNGGPGHEVGGCFDDDLVQFVAAQGEAELVGFDIPVDESHRWRIEVEDGAIEAMGKVGAR